VSKLKKRNFYSSKRLFRLITVISNRDGHVKLFHDLISTIHSTPMSSGIRDVCRALMAVNKKFGNEICLRVVKLSIEMGWWTYTYYPYLTLAEMLAEGDTGSIGEVVAIYRESPILEFDDIGFISDGIRREGKVTLLAGMALAPEPHEPADEYYSAEVINAVGWSQKKRAYTIATARIGLSNLRNLIDDLEVAKFSERSIVYFVNELAPWVFGCGEEPDAILRWIRATIRLLEGTDYVSDHSWTYEVYNAMSSYKATEAEIREMLWLAVKYNVKSAGDQGFVTAIQLWRRFSRSFYAFEAMREDKLGSLPLYIGMIRLEDHDFGLRGDAEREEYLRHVECKLHADVSIATLKFLNRRHTALGFDLRQRLAIAQLTMPAETVALVEPFIMSQPAMLGGSGANVSVESDTTIIPAEMPADSKVLLLEKELRIYQRVFRMMKERIETECI